MLEIFTYIQVFVLGWFACRIYTGIKLQNALRRIAEENGMTLEELGQNIFDMKGIKTSVIKVPNLTTELTKNSILLYNKDTGDFVAQAGTVEELAENAYKFSNIKLALVNHNEEKLWFVEGKVRNDLKEIE